MKKLFNKIKKLPTTDYRLPTNHGFAILFAVLISSAILAISLGVAGVASREIALSSIAKEGGKALFAADTGIECGLYNDVQANEFLQPPVSVICGGQTIDVPAEISDINSANYFEFKVSLFNDEMCTKVRVYKNLTKPGEPNTTYTRIEAFGYNYPCDVLDPLNTSAQPNNLVERALRATYENTGGGGNQQPSFFQITSPQPLTGQVNSQNLSNMNVNSPQQLQVGSNPPTPQTTTNAKPQ